VVFSGPKRSKREITIMAIKHGLGRGLGALLNDGRQPPARPNTPAAPAAEEPAPTSAPVPTPPPAGPRKVPIAHIRTNPWQPRHEWDTEALADLVASVKDRGVIQPLLVRANADGFQLIAGERRLRAATEAGLTEVPVIVTEAADQDMVELALIENIQREDLNVIEEAEAYQLLAEKFGLTQEQIATRVGKARASVTNTMRLLAMPPEVRLMVAEGKLSAGHAKVILGLEIPAEQLLYATRVITEDLSVRDLEKQIRKTRRIPMKKRATRDHVPATHVAHLTDRLKRHFGTEVRLTSSRTYANGSTAKGSIEIDFYSADDLDRLLELLGVSVE